MRRSVVLVPLALAAPAGCWMPNPLFLESATAVSEASLDPTVSAGSLVSDPTADTTETNPTTETTTPAPTSEGTSTTTGPVTTADLTATSTATTEPEGFMCDKDKEDDEGCCEVELLPEADAFFIDSFDQISGAAKPCTFTESEQLSPIPCKLRNYGKSPSQPVFKNGVEVVGSGYFGVRFPLEGSAFLHEDGPIPIGWVKGAATLGVSGEFAWGKYDKLTLGVHALPEGALWAEGEGLGHPCGGDDSSRVCLECGGDPSMGCAQGWALDVSPDTQLATFEIVESQENNTRGECSFDPNTLLEHPEGLLVAFAGAVLDNQTAVDAIRHDEIKLFAREAEAAPVDKRPRLRLRVCPLP